MENINTVFVKAIELNRNIGSLLRLSIYKDYNDLNGLPINYDAILLNCTPTAPQLACIKKYQ